MPDDLFSNLIYQRNQYGVTGVINKKGEDLLTPTIDESKIRRGSITIGANPITGGTSETLRPIGSTTSTFSVTPTNIKLPEMQELPELVIPEIDEGRISELTRKISDPYVRSLSREARRALMKHYDNPNVARMVARETLAGYGEGLATALSSAGTQARSEEAAERATGTQTALTEYQANINRNNAIYQSAWNNYLSQIGRKSVTTNIYNTEELAS